MGDPKLASHISRLARDVRIGDYVDPKTTSYENLTENMEEELRKAIMAIGALHWMLKSDWSAYMGESEEAVRYLRRVLNEEGKVRRFEEDLETMLIEFRRWMRAMNVK